MPFSLIRSGHTSKKKFPFIQNLFLTKKILKQPTLLTSPNPYFRQTTFRPDFALQSFPLSSQLYFHLRPSKWIEYVTKEPAQLTDCPTPTLGNWIFTRPHGLDLLIKLQPWRHQELQKFRLPGYVAIQCYQTILPRKQRHHQCNPAHHHPDGDPILPRQTQIPIEGLSRVAWT